MGQLKGKLHQILYNFRTYSWMLDPRRFLSKGDFALNKPIFLLGTQGGGLTLLSRMLRRHRDVISVAGNHRYWTSSDEMQNTFGMFLPQDFSGMRYKAPPHPRFPPPRSWTYATDEVLPLYRKRSTDLTPKVKQAFRDAIRFAVLRHGHNRQVRFLDKSQSYSVRVGLIYEALAEYDPQFVLVPREPYISVYRAAIGKAGDMARLLETLSYEERIEACAQHYANSMNAIYEDCDALGIKVHLLRFEDLLQDPEPRLRETCDFLDLEFIPQMIPSAEDRLPPGSRFLDRWYPVKPGINDSYESKLDALTIDTVNKKFGNLLERMGYPRR